ncbi:hypothetical protein [Haloferula rosea]|uniref:Uncharacterized protein n=1 Tax=Haloferula rosea TaxID=490093 RepID=A0A934R9J0_9BACT|nr:hypothetical protein [Haloferula rosea]MBK1825688.1 hypothetical protein [Haloferula rosea]
MKPSNSLTTLLSLMAVVGVGSSPASASTLEDWQFNEAADTPFTGLVNSAGTAAWAGNVANVATDGSGHLVFSVSVDDPETTEVDESTDNLFRTTDVTTPGATTGKFELAFTYQSATLAGGDATGANVGFTVRNSSNVDLLNVRLQKQNGDLRLQRRNSSTGLNTDLEDFAQTSLTGPLEVRVIFDMDSDTYDVYWTPDGQPQRCQTNIPMDITGSTLDRLRLYASTNATDWGATDEVAVDFLTLSTYTDPPVAPAIEDWQFNIDGESLGNAQNDAGTGTLGGNADNAVTSGGNMVFTQGTSDTDSIFRNGDITTPDQTTGRFGMEWFVPSATLSGGDVTGANVGFGMRDKGAGTDLFIVRLHRQNSSLLLQTRVGNTNTTLVDFGVTTITDLNVSVVADLDTDTFDVHWQLGDGIGNCVSGIAMAATGLEFDQVRTTANTNTLDWGAADEVLVDYLVIRDLNAPTDLSLSIVQGPGAGEITLVWPIATPANAVLEESTDLGASDAWEQVVGVPVENGDNFELTISTPGTPANFYRLNTP